MRKCLEDLQIPCRWVPDMGYGNGFPLFNYYSVFPYYLGAILSYILGYLGAAKALFLIPLVAGGVTMYLLARQLWGRLSGITAAALYLFAPYRALDAYVRGAVAESFALALIPLVFYFLLRLIKKPSQRNFLGLSLSSAAFLTTHNIMTLLFVPVIFIWGVLFLWIQKWAHLKTTVFSLLLGFFLLPAFVETSLVRTDTLTRMDLNFRAHFVTVGQLFFDRSFGYGASIPGPFDSLSFQIGWPHWWLVPAAVVLGLLGWLVKKDFLNKLPARGFILIILLALAFLMSVFMTHNRSAFVWEAIGLLRFFQFPWRFLSLAIFSASLLGGALILILAGRAKKVVLVLIIVSTMALNWSFFKPEHFFPTLTDRKKLSGEMWETQQKASILDYLPKTAYEPQERAPNRPIIVSGQVTLGDFDNRSNRWNFSINVSEKAVVEIPVFDFPVWQVTVNGQKFPYSHDNLMGRVMIDLQPGEYQVAGKLTNTPIRNLGNIITLISLLITGGVAWYGKRQRIFH